MQQAAILYDAECGFCRWSADKILALAAIAGLAPGPTQAASGD